MQTSAQIVSAGAVMDPRGNVLGIGVNAINLDSAAQTIDAWIETRAQKYVCVTGVHGTMESQRQRDLRRVHNRAGLVTPDGMPLVWLLRLQGFPNVDRVYGPDLMHHVIGRSDRYRHFFYGSSADTLKKLERRMKARHPNCQIVGTYAPPLRPALTREDNAVIDLINRSRPDIVWVGLSTPKQEFWMADHRALLSAPVLIGVGAAFDLNAGKVRQAPRFVQRSGLEWLFRMCMEPRRLSRRYLRNNPIFVAQALLQMTGLRTYSIAPDSGSNS